MKVYIVGQIDGAAFMEFSKQLDDLTATEPLHVVINSEGGSALDALAFVGRLRQVRNKVRTITAYGFVASAATLILACFPGKRRMSKESMLMVHEDEGEETGSVSEMERVSKHLRRMEIHWNKIMAESTKISENEWSILNSKTTYFDAHQCADYGIVDEVI